MTQRKKIATVVGFVRPVGGRPGWGCFAVEPGADPGGNPVRWRRFLRTAVSSEFASMSEEKRWSRKTPLSAMLRSLPRGGLPVLLSTGWTANPGGESSGRGACQAV